MTDVAGEADPREARTLPARCSNCERALDGPFCSSCGQKAVELHRPLRQLLSEVFEDALSLDTRLARTLRPLLFRPVFWVGLISVLFIGLSTF